MASPEPRPTPPGNLKARLVCLACGRALETPLAVTGSLRCLACREVKAQLDPSLVRQWHDRGAQF